MKQTRSTYNDRLVSRIRQIREDSGYSREKMAELIGCSYAAMQRYEDRSPMPHYYLCKFCLVTGNDLWQVLTGRPSYEGDLQVFREDPERLPL